MSLWKANATGNTFVLIDHETDHPQELAVNLCADHNTDGLLLFMNMEMRIFNADGTIEPLCGNGLRCIGRYLQNRFGYTHHIVDTGIGRLSVDILGDLIRADLGYPLFFPQSLVNFPIDEHKIIHVRVGGPHAVIFDSIEDIEAMGQRIETDPNYQERVNVHFVEMLQWNRFRICSWERGVGHTLSCGTGIAAACAAASYSKRGRRVCYVESEGGELFVEWATNNHLYVTGPAEVIPIE